MSVVRRATSTQPPSTLRPFRTPTGLPSLAAIRAEMDEYVAVIKGDESPPWENGVITLQEVANAYYTRAREIEALIYRGENGGDIPRNSTYMKFRTGELQPYIAIFRHADELGSRRITAAKEFRDD